ncbi:MAG TPA: hypothetical protein PKJ77_04645 [Thermodesulfobacteriota bacterium]|nr:hypothetical protein [Thermodesulfobacteriota bacterium]HNU72030.1 hypothetical protein [Thermodesulfobacteriota bacterium]HOC38545.1 hypothetical protein [Thermodesulfobacteriota bacterium]
MKIKINTRKCSGCHLCSLVCSLVHGGAANTERSAIRIEKDDLDTSLNQPVLCRQCRNMTCLQGEDAVPDEEMKRFSWPVARAERCPFHALPVFGGQSFHCNLCNGDPQCLSVCTTGALVLEVKSKE